MALDTQTNVDKEINEGILRKYLGVDDPTGIDFGTYKTLLREKIAAARMGGSDIDSGDISYLTNEFIRIKKIEVPEGQAKKKIDINKFLERAEEKKKADTKSEEKLLDVSPAEVSSEKKPSVNPQKLLPPAPDLDESQNINSDFAQSLRDEFDSKLDDFDKRLDDLLEDIRNDKDEKQAVIDDLKSENEEQKKALNMLAPSFASMEENLEDILNNTKEQTELREKAARQAESNELKSERKDREAALESKGSKVGESVKKAEKATKPLGGFLDMILNFLKNILLGGALVALMNFIEDPGKMLDPVFDKINEIISFINKILTNIFNFIFDPINAVIKGVYDGLNAIENAINSAIGMLPFGLADKVPGYPFNNIDPSQAPVLTPPQIEPIKNPFSKSSGESEPQQQQSQESQPQEKTQQTPPQEKTQQPQQPQQSQQSPAPQQTQQSPAPQQTQQSPAPQQTQQSPAPQQTQQTQPVPAMRGGGVVFNPVINMSTPKFNSGGIVNLNTATPKFNSGGIVNLNTATPKFNSGGVVNNFKMDAPKYNSGGVVNNFKMGAPRFIGGGSVNQNINPQTVNNFSYASGGSITSNSGQKISGMGADTQLIAAQPGEVVMSKSAVNYWGAGNLLAMNKEGGGTNKPKMGKVRGFVGGGYIDDVKAHDNTQGPNEKKMIYLHWNAGANTSTGPYGNYGYHTMFPVSGKPARGYKYGSGWPYHTWNRNTPNAAGLAVSGNVYARQENTKSWGKHQVANNQYKAMAKEAAALATIWGWRPSDVNKSRVLTHFELGHIDGYPGEKWDLERLQPGDAPGSGPDKIRNMIRSFMGGMKDDTPVDDKPYFEAAGGFYSKETRGFLGSTEEEAMIKTSKSDMLTGPGPSGASYSASPSTSPSTSSTPSSSAGRVSSPSKPSIPGAPSGGGTNVRILPLGGGKQQAGSASNAGQTRVDGFSPIDMNNPELIVIKSIYNVVG